MKTIKNITPGLALSIAVATVAVFLEKLLPGHYVSASVIALIVGMLLNTRIRFSPRMKKGFKFSSKQMLRLAIILLGATLNIGMVLNVGSLSLSIIVFTLIAAFGFANLVRKHFNVNAKLANLIAAGNGICGGSAIAALSPVIEAEDTEVAFAMSSTFLFDVAMIIAFPIMGHFLGMSDIAYGLWTGTAVNDTSSVVAAGYAFSDAAGNFATTVKLTRTLSIIPTVLIFSFLTARNTSKKEHTKVSLSQIFPWFILGFVILALINTSGILPMEGVNVLKATSKFLMVVALASIGLNTHFEDIRKIGWKPVIFGVLTAMVVIVVALVVIAMMNLM